MTKLKSMRDKLEQAGDLKKKMQEKEQESDKLLEQVVSPALLCLIIPCGFAHMHSGRLHTDVHTHARMPSMPVSCTLFPS